MRPKITNLGIFGLEFENNIVIFEKRQKYLNWN